MSLVVDLGRSFRLTIAITDPDNDDAAVDPATLTVRVKDPSDNTDAYVYGTDAELVKDSTGNYHIDVPTDERGEWYYEVESGTPDDRQQGKVRVVGESV